MALIVPHRQFPNIEMMAAVQRLTEKGALKFQEVHMRAQDEIMKETFVAGYAQCMADFGLDEESKKVNAQ